MSALAAFSGLAQGLGAGLDMRQKRKEKLADDARTDAYIAAIGKRGGMGLPGGADGGQGGSGSNWGDASGTWTPAAPGPKATDLPIFGHNGTMTYGGRQPQQPGSGDPRLGFGSATMTPQEMLIAGAKQRGYNPIDVATAISYETGGTFDPMISGPTTQWGTHRGLIQFGEPQAKENGVDFTDANTAWRSQLDPNSGAVWRYLDKAGVKSGMALPEIYSAINAGRVGRMNATDENNGGAPGTVAEKVAGMGPHRMKAAAFLGGTWTPAGGDAVAAQRAKLRAQYPAFRNVSDADLDAAIAANQTAIPPRGRGLPAPDTLY